MVFQILYLFPAIILFYYFADIAYTMLDKINDICYKKNVTLDIIYKFMMAFFYVILIYKSYTYL